MKKTALFQTHTELGAKMVPFAGYEMPLQYSGLLDEHDTVRQAVGMFDVSHMGEFFVEGKGALDLLQTVTSNDVDKLEPGKVQYSCLPNGEGGIVDDLLVYCINPDRYMLVVNASNIDKDWAWIKGKNEGDVSIENASDEYALLAVQGPLATKTLQKLTSLSLAEMPYYTFKKGTFAGIEHVILSATGYTGSGGFEVYVRNEFAHKAWNAIMSAGDEFGIKPIGLGARDTLRLEMGFCLYGNDIDDTTSPIEAGLGWITKFNKDFIDKERLQAQKEEGVSRKLVGFEMVERGIPRHDYPVIDAAGSVIGRVTSGTQSPSLQKAIGMGYVPRELAAIGSEIYIEIRQKPVLARVVKLPFYTAP